MLYNNAHLGLLFQLQLYKSRAVPLPFVWMLQIYTCISEIKIWLSRLKPASDLTKVNEKTEFRELSYRIYNEGNQLLHLVYVPCLSKCHVVFSFVLKENPVLLAQVWSICALMLILNGVFVNLISHEEFETR